MRLDLGPHLGAVTRTVSALEREGKPARNVTLERSYDTTTEDLWDAVTNPERLPRWFLPISGDLKLGGRYQLEGNAGGTITECVPPVFFAATWEFGGGMSWVEVRIAPEGDARSRLTLSHICAVDDHWQKYGPGAAGVGWDLGLLGLAVHLSGPGADRMNEDAFMASGGKAVIAGASEDWRRAAVAGGENPAQAEAAAKRTTAFYTGEESQEG
jgi:uncharacterized protein YndB with AHSA1/START domain